MLCCSVAQCREHGIQLFNASYETLAVASQVIGAGCRELVTVGCPISLLRFTAAADDRFKHKSCYVKGYLYLYQQMVIVNVLQ